MATKIMRINALLWGCVKTQAYINKPTTLTQLENNIIREIVEIIDDIQPDLCQRVSQIGSLGSIFVNDAAEVI